MFDLDVRAWIAELGRRASIRKPYGVRYARCTAMARSMVVALFMLHGATSVAAPTLPSGFVDSMFVQVPPGATSMAFAPDGRLFITQQGGRLRVVDNGKLLATPFVTLTVDANAERGLLGVAFDPDFSTNHYVYVYYTATTPTIHNRVSRFTANGNVAVAGSEKILLELNTLGTAMVHNGGAIHFGNDGKLYIAVGDNARGTVAQSLDNLFGKILRINKDGTIPTANPFYTRTTGSNRTIWAYGLRNPFTTAFQRSTGRLYINDVGLHSYEEINNGVAGANYGWPVAEGPSTNAAFTNPIYAYAHVGDNCAIIGGAFYEPQSPTFPVVYHDQYFFTDMCAGWIRRLNPETRAVTGFATGLDMAVDLKVGPDGALYYLARNLGYVGRISYAVSQAPEITVQPTDETVAVGQSVTFRVGATGSAPLAFQWRRNGSPITGATSASYTRSNVQFTDNGAMFDVVVRNSIDTAVSEAAQLTVLQNALPSASITQPVAGTTYAGGNVISYAGKAWDPEDGTLPPSAFTWWVDFHHNAHTHPYRAAVSGSRIGQFKITTIGETSANVFYRIHLRVKDSRGTTRSVYRDVKPRKTTVTLATNPAGMPLRLDGTLVSTPHRFVGVEGIQRTIEAPSPQSAFGSNWVFSWWSDGGTRSHTISTPVDDKTYTAKYVTQ
jgi:glucose/arabinose dehydrogenase